MEKRWPKIFRFASRVLYDFFLHNHGLLLTAAVANNMMLSLIPLSAVLLVVVSHIFEPQRLLGMIASEVKFIAPEFVPILTDVLQGFLRSRELIGSVGLLSLFVFSSFAFRVLEDAFAIIFHRPLPTLKRKFWISALMPYLFISVIAIGLIAITALNVVVDSGIPHLGMIPWLDTMLQRNLSKIVYLAGLGGLTLLFTMFYHVMPVAKISFRLALAGGVTATILWELTRHLLVSYYKNVSVVNVLYGSMATIIVVLLTLEAVALILLLGAQVIADLQRSINCGVKWYEEPAEPLEEKLMVVDR